MQSMDLVKLDRKGAWVLDRSSGVGYNVILNDYGEVVYRMKAFYVVCGKYGLSTVKLMSVPVRILSLAINEMDKQLKSVGSAVEM